MKSQGHVHELISHLIYSLPHSSNLTECKLVNINGFYSLLQESQLTSFELYFFTSFKIHYKCISNYITSRLTYLVIFEVVFAALVTTFLTKNKVLPLELRAIYLLCQRSFCFSVLLSDIKNYSCRNGTGE